MPASVTPVPAENSQLRFVEPGKRPELSRRIKQRALGEGFEKVGIVPAVALDREGDQLRRWLDRGYHGNMAWMARAPEVRTDPRKSGGASQGSRDRRRARRPGRARNR